MIHKLFAIFFVLCAVQNALGGGGDVVKCDGGPVQCCNKYGTKEELKPSQFLLALLGLNIQDIVGNIGLECSPIGVGIVGGGASGQSCTQQTVCCQNNNFSGLIALGCTPININA